jgi:hypothetical protein
MERHFGGPDNMGWLTKVFQKEAQVESNGDGSPGCTLHILDAKQAQPREMRCLIGKHVSREIYERNRDSEGHLYGLVYYADEKPLMKVVHKEIWLKEQHRIKVNRPEVQKISFHCAKDGTEFSVLFVRESSEDKFRIRSIESPHVNTDQHHKQSFLEWAGVRVNSNVSGKSQSFDANEFDIAGWKCACCQYSSWPQYVRCSKCNRLICGSKIISIQNGPKTFRCAPDCGGGGVVEGQISTYTAEGREMAKEKTKELPSGGKPLNLSQPSQLQDKPAIAIQDSRKRK